MSSESISDKLRRWADESKNKQRHIYPTLNAGEDFGINLNQEDFIIECELFHRIADEIDAEKQSTLRNCAYPLTQEVGKPLKGDEDFESWLDRYYLPRPLFEDGKPAQFGDRFVRGFGRDAKIDSLSYTKGNSNYVNINGRERHDFAHRLKRPKPQVLDADGVPIVVGDKVWMLPGKHCGTFPLYGYKAGVEYTVSENENAIHKEDGRICITGGGYTCGYPMPEQVTHREPDSQERIDRDAVKGEYEYWGCTGSECHNCPALVDGKKPNQRYGILWCGSATRLDLLRRQRELDGRDA